MKIVAVYNMKGGVGKTTSAVNLAYLAAADGYRTLLCDLDAQGSASFYLRVKAPKKFSAKHLAKGDNTFFDSIQATNYENLDIIPADFSFRNLPIVLDKKKRSKKRLKETLNQLKKEYDIIMLDAPAGLDLEAENIFFASDTVLIPIIPSILSVQTLQKIHQFFEKHTLDITKLRIFFSLVDKRKKIHTQTMEELRERMSNILFSWIPYSSTIEKMGITREPVPLRSKKSKAALSYIDLWKELKEQIQSNGTSVPADKTTHAQFIS